MGNRSRKLSKCNCTNCGIEFEKPVSEIKRNKRLNRPNFCSRTCVGKNNIKNLPTNNENYDISKHSGNNKDGFTKFRYHFRNVKKRDKDVSISLEDLKDIWDRQDGICPYLKIKLILSGYSKIEKNPIYSASIDRIDSAKGYTKDNIQWVSRSMNLMKNTMTSEQVFEILKLIKENKGV